MQIYIYVMYLFTMCKPRNLQKQKPMELVVKIRSMLNHSEKDRVLGFRIFNDVQIYSNSYLIRDLEIFRP